VLLSHNMAAEPEDPTVNRSRTLKSLIPKPAPQTLMTVDDVNAESVLPSTIEMFETAATAEYWASDLNVATALRSIVNAKS
jgi:hypothetical protein